MKKRKSKSRNSKKIIIIIIILAIIALSAYFVYKNFYNSDKDEEVKIEKSIKKYNYYLNENETKLYKQKFNELSKILSKDDVDNEEYAKKIAELFVIDFYTLNNKISKNDIGGVDFVIPSLKDNFVEQARSTFYRYIEINSTTKSSSLPEVSKIEKVTAENTTFTYKNKTTEENAYKVNISWDYKKDLGYEDEAKMILVLKNKKMYIVEMD